MRPGNAKSRSLTCCSSVRRDSARRRWRCSWRKSWTSTSGPRPAPCSSGLATWSACSRHSRPATSSLSMKCTACGPHAQTIPMQLERFTLIGATTRFGLLTPPLRARFGLVERLHYYPPDDLVQIITRSAGILGVGADAAGVAEIARRSRGTPRVANRLLKRVRDYAQVRAGGKITAAVAAEALKRLDVDEFGLDYMDARILKAIIEMFEGGPVGVQTVAAAVGEDPGTLEEVYEPFLMQQGFLARTPRGRVATPAAYRHFGFVPPKSAEQASIFGG